MDDDIHVDLPKFLQTASRNIPNNSDLWMLGLLQVKTDTYVKKPYRKSLNGFTIVDVLKNVQTLSVIDMRL